MAEGWVNESYVQVWQDVSEALRKRAEEEHQIVLELEAKLQFMTERCKAMESEAARYENEAFMLRKRERFLESKLYGTF